MSDDVRVDLVQRTIVVDVGPTQSQLTALAAAAANSAAQAEVSASFAAEPRSKLIGLGVPQTQNVADKTKTGFLMTSITSPAARRTITRAADKITIATTLALTVGVIYEESDQRGGLLYRAEFEMTAGASATRAVGIGITTNARADTARADSTQTTPVDIDAIADTDTKLFALRATGGPTVAYQTVANAPATETTSIAFSSFTASPVTWVNGDRIRAEAWVPDDDTSQRRVDFYKRAVGETTFVRLGYILVDASKWPAGSEMWAGAYSALLYTVDIFADGMTVTAPQAEEAARRWLEPSAAIVGMGARDEPVTSLSDLFTSVNEETDNLTGMIGANGGEPYRIVSSTGIVIPWARWREVVLVGDAGAMPEIRGSMPAPDPWTNVSGDVWQTANYFNNVATSAQGGVISYDSSEITGFSLPGAKQRYILNAGNGVNAAGLTAIGIPCCSVQAGGAMYLYLPGGEDPNDLDLELVQTTAPLAFAGPSAAGLLWRPRVTLAHLAIYGSNQYILQAKVWDVLYEQLHLGACGLEVLLHQECAGITRNCRLAGSAADNFKLNPYTGHGGTEYYSDEARPWTTHYDLHCHAAGYAGYASVVGDNASLHAKGGPQAFYGGRFWDASKHNHSHLDDFDVRGTDCRRGAQGGIVAAMDANRDGEFTIMDNIVLDAGVGAIQVTRTPGTGTSTGTICGNRLGRPNVATPVGILVTNTAGSSQIVFDDVDNRIDTGIASARSGYGSATVSQRTYA